MFRPSDYLRQMNELVRRRDLRGALNLLDVDMKREYVQPNEKHFRLLIHACGREGYHRYSMYARTSQCVLLGHQSNKILHRYGYAMLHKCSATFNNVK